MMCYLFQKLTKTPIETAVGCFCTACDRSYSKFKWNSKGKPCTLSVFWVVFFFFVWTLHNTSHGHFPPNFPVNHNETKPIFLTDGNRYNAWLQLR